MPVSGAKPKADRSQVRHRVPAAHDWSEIENAPFAGAPPLRDRETQVSWADAGVVPAGGWPESTLMWWKAISTMPHAATWAESDWVFAMDTAEIHARTMEAWRGYTGAQLTTREKVLGVTADARRDLRIRYVEPKPKDDPAKLPADVARLDDYREL